MDTSNKKTIICYIASLTRGGAEKVMAGLANYLEEKGHNVYLVTLEPEEGLYPLNKGLKQVIMTDIGPVKASKFNDITVTFVRPDCYFGRCEGYLPPTKASPQSPDSSPKATVGVNLKGPLSIEEIPHYTKGIKRIAATAGRVSYLRRFIRQTGADAILAFMGKTNLRAIMAAWGTGCRSVVSVRSAPEREYPGAFRSMLAKLLFCLSDGIVFQSKGAMSFFPAACRKRAKIIFNPLDEIFFEELPEIPIRREIVTAGRLSEIKNHALLIDAFYIFHKNHPDFKLIIYGEGECRGALEERIKGLGLTGSVLLPGDEKNIRDRIRGAALFVLSSDFEGMPNAIAEAMALKIPVVATDAPSGGIKALVGNNERGLLVPVKNPEKMAGAMERLNSDPELLLRVRSAAFKFTRKLHPDIIRKEWMDFILKE